MAEVNGQLVRSALMVGACEMIPVPVVDHIAQGRVRRAMVERLLRDHGRRQDAGDLKPIWTGGWGGFLVDEAAEAALKVVRTLTVVLGLRRAVLEAGETFLLGRTLDRLLAAGWFASEMPGRQQVEDANRVADAVARTWRQTHWSALRQAMSDGLKLTKGPDKSVRLTAAVSAVVAKLNSAQGQRVLAELDAAIDAALARSAART